jgi:hypothetical protein
MRELAQAAPDFAPYTMLDGGVNSRKADLESPIPE